jgi:hypothetical protein
MVSEPMKLDQICRSGGENLPRGKLLKTTGNSRLRGTMVPGLVTRIEVGLTLVTLTFLLTGCIGALPLPRVSSQPTHGTQLRAKDIAFIRVGTTSASELFGTLGTDCVCDPRHRAVAFSWELAGGRGVWWWALVTTEAAGGGAGEFEWSRWRAFFVAFDTNNVMTAANSKHLSSSKSLHEQLEAWARKHHAAPDRIHPEICVAKGP